MDAPTKRRLAHHAFQLVCSFQNRPPSARKGSNEDCRLWEFLNVHNIYHPTTQVRRGQLLWAHHQWAAKYPTRSERVLVPVRNELIDEFERLLFP